MKIKNLYIIGNGFDCFHKIDSSYSSYKKWLNDNYIELYEDLINFYGAYNEKWWWQFELNLGNADFSNYILQTSSLNEPDYGSDEFRDRDYYNAQFQVENEIGLLINRIKDSFKEWVSSLHPGKNIDKIELKKDNSFYINFNYTHTLQNIYNISSDRILHIHGDVNSKDLVIGHNKTQNELLIETSECLSVAPNYITQLTRDATVLAFSSIRKNVESVIAGNEKIFSSFKNVEHIYVYGFSFSIVDLPYLEKIINTINKSKTKWNISYYTNEDSSRITDFMIKNKIPTHLWKPLMQLENIKVCRQLNLKI